MDEKAHDGTLRTPGDGPRLFRFLLLMQAFFGPLVTRIHVGRLSSGKYRVHTYMARHGYLMNQCHQMTAAFFFFCWLRKRHVNGMQPPTHL